MDVTVDTDKSTEFDVTITVTNNPGVATLILSLDYGDYIEPVLNSNNLPTVVFGGFLNNGGEASVEDGKLKIVWLASDGANKSDENITIVLRFKLKDGVTSINNGQLVLKVAE
jgi:hypothetical protein